MIIDCHGHYTTAPKALEVWRNQQIAGIKDPILSPKVSDLKISDDELRESIESNQLRLMRERGSDLTLFSPRASFMAHHIGDLNVSSTWAAICNELCYRVSQLFPEHFVPVAMLPQSPGVDPASCIPELEKCVKEYGNVGINLNPDPSGGHWTSPPLSDKHWYPVYEKMVEYDIPAMIHVSTSCNACFHTTGAHYLNADTTAFMQCLTSDLFKDFPTLRFLIPHGGGAVPYHWGRFRGLAQELKKPLLSEHLLNNIYFDTCVYHQPGIDLLNTVIPVKNVLFASEMIGAVRGIDPETGHFYDDTKRYIEASKILGEADRQQIYEGNARRVFPRLDALLAARQVSQMATSKTGFVQSFQAQTMSIPNAPHDVGTDAPLDNFSHCHDGIITHLNALGRLAEQAELALRARQAAEDTRHFFRDVIYNHHEEEERVLFEAVLASATEGEELAKVKAIADRLTVEHRQVESMYERLEPELKKMARGHDCHLVPQAIQTLVRVYLAHAAYEESEFLPLSQTILGRNSNHMAALGLSLHVRHVSLTPAHF